jgi:hypothetical protein
LQAERLGTLDVGLQRLVAGRGPHPVGIEALVEHQALEDRLAVEQHRTALEGDAAQPEVAVHLIEHRRRRARA